MHHKFLKNGMRRLALAVAASYLAALQTVLASTGTTTSTSTIENQIFYDGFNFPNSTSSWSNDYKANHYNTGHPVWTESRDSSTSTEGILIIEQNSPGWGNADSQDGNTFIAFKRPVVNFSTSISGMTAGFLYDVKFKAMNRNDCNNCGDATLFVYMDDMLMFRQNVHKKRTVKLTQNVRNRNVNLHRHKQRSRGAQVWQRFIRRNFRHRNLLGCRLRDQQFGDSANVVQQQSVLAAAVVRK